MRLIDAEEYDSLLREYRNNPGLMFGIQLARNLLKKQRYVDAVPVVRCRECIHYEMGVCMKIYDDGAASSYAWQKRNHDDFCSYGERKEGAD